MMNNQATKPIPCTIKYGQTEIAYELLMMERKSLEIAVHPDKSVIVKAPNNSSLESIEEKVRKRARWIKRQIAYFNQFDPRTPPRQYVGGETHLYLGGRYRLKIKLSDRNKVLLKNGYFMIDSISNDPEHIKELVLSWYKMRASVYLPKIFEECWNSFNTTDMSKPNLRLQKMIKRWGSLSKSGQLRLNSDLIRAPKDCIEYVVIHELCHLFHDNHGAEFYRLLDTKMPDWIKRKHKLEMSLI